VAHRFGVPPTIFVWFWVSRGRSVLNVLLTAHVLLATRTVVCNVTDQSNKWLFHVIVPVSLFADMVISEGKGR
jgi:hypothetical protein